ncbi:MAG: multiubiquitin domain-containing protein [Ignavibacteria bacterium]|nr:multiubiquitin domain-containing protein [Ignavibacteria bacterium]
MEETKQKGEKEAPKLKIKIDGTMYDVSQKMMTGRELLALAGKTPIERYEISKREKGNIIKKVAYEEVVDLSDPGLEKFVTLPLDQTDGEGLEKAFLFSEEDESFLSTLGRPWETIRDNNSSWLLMHNFPVPNGYNAVTVIAAIQIPVGYPDSQLDMVYFYPALSRKDGKQIRATEANTIIRGISYQRWSRHLTSNNPWRPGIDNLNTFYFYIENWLKREIEN